MGAPLEQIKSYKVFNAMISDLSLSPMLRGKLGSPLLVKQRPASSQYYILLVAIGHCNDTAHPSPSRARMQHLSGHS